MSLGKKNAKSLSIKSTGVHPSVSLTNFMQAHPYQYLKQLNANFNYCNHNNIKGYSKASKLKLPWKQFTLVKIPKFFQETYAQQKADRRQTLHNTAPQQRQISKIWKQHEQIVKRYQKGYIKKQDFYLKENIKRKQQNEVAKKLTEKDRRNLFLKKIIEKGANIQFDSVDIKDEIIAKLAELKQKGSIRASTAKFGRQKSNLRPCDGLSKFQTIRPTTIDKERKHLINFQEVDLDNLKDYVQVAKKNNFVQQNQKAKIYESYKVMIKSIDCSISEKNILKTKSILKEMSNMLNI